MPWPGRELTGPVARHVIHQQEGPPLTSTNFQSVSYIGRLTVSGGTGLDRLAKGTAATVTCSSPDSVHMSCTYKLKLTRLPG